MDVHSRPPSLIPVLGVIGGRAGNWPGMDPRDGDRGGRADRDQGAAGEHEGAPDSNLLDGCRGDERRHREGAGDARLPESEGLREVAIRDALLHERDQRDVRQGGREARDCEQESSDERGLSESEREAEGAE